MRIPSDLKQRVINGQTFNQIGRLYGTSGPSISKAFDEVFKLKDRKLGNTTTYSHHGKHTDLTEEDIFIGYMPPKPIDLQGYELEIFNNL